MKIINSTLEDLDDIFNLYDHAISYQKSVSKKGWRGFERAMVEKEINEKRHFKIVDEGILSCTFLIAFSNPNIWRDSGIDNAIYLHRIATNANFRGRSYVNKIVDWSVAYGKRLKKSAIRLDTHSGNTKLNNYYISCGFTYKGIVAIDWTSDLPEHYKEGPFSIFEIIL